MSLKVCAIIQARLGSTRMPRKVLAPLCGRPMLWHILERVKRATLVDQVVLAVPQESDSHLVEALADECRVRYFRFDHIPAEDLVSRYLGAAQCSGADVVVRVCADNPCVEWTYIDEAVQEFLDHPWIFYSNTTASLNAPGQTKHFDGLGCEVLTLSRLKWLDRVTKDNADWREHPHKAFYDFYYGDYGEGISINWVDPRFVTRLDVNTPDDFAFIEDIYTHVYPANPAFTIADVLAYLHTKEHAPPLAARETTMP